MTDFQKAVWTVLFSATAVATTGGTTAETEATDQGTDIRSQASEPETTQAVICRGHKRPMSISMPIRVRALKKATAEIACLGMIKGPFQAP